MAEAAPAGSVPEEKSEHSLIEEIREMDAASKGKALWMAKGSKDALFASPSWAAMSKSMHAARREPAAAAAFFGEHGGGAASSGPTRDAIKRTIVLQQTGPFRKYHLFANLEVVCECGLGWRTYTQPIFYTPDDDLVHPTQCRSFSSSCSTGSECTADEKALVRDKGKTCVHCHNRMFQGVLGCCKGTEEASDRMCAFEAVPVRIIGDHGNALKLISEGLRTLFKEDEFTRAQASLYADYNDQLRDKLRDKPPQCRFFCPCIHCIGHYGNDDPIWKSLLDTPLLDDEFLNERVQALCVRDGVHDSQKYIDATAVIDKDKPCSLCQGAVNSYIHVKKPRPLHTVIDLLESPSPLAPSRTTTPVDDTPIKEYVKANIQQFNDMLTYDCAKKVNIIAASSVSNDEAFEMIDTIVSNQESYTLKHLKWEGVQLLQKIANGVANTQTAAAAAPAPEGSTGGAARRPRDHEGVSPNKNPQKKASVVKDSVSSLMEQHPPASPAATASITAAGRSRTPPPQSRGPPSTQLRKGERKWHYSTGVLELEF